MPEEVVKEKEDRRDETERRRRRMKSRKRRWTKFHMFQIAPCTSSGQSVEWFGPCVCLFSWEGPGWPKCGS